MPEVRQALVGLASSFGGTVGLFRKKQQVTVNQSLLDLLVGETDDIRASRELELRHLAYWQPHILEVIEALREDEAPQMLSVGYRLSLIGLVDEDCRIGVLLITNQRSFGFEELISGPTVFEHEHANLTEIEYKRDSGPADKRVTQVCLRGRGDRDIAHPVLMTSTADFIVGP